MDLRQLKRDLESTSYVDDVSYDTQQDMLIVTLKGGREFLISEPFSPDMKEPFSATGYGSDEMEVGISSASDFINKVKKGIIKSGKKKTIGEAVDVMALVKELGKSFGGDNASQMKGVQLLKGLATSDDPKANEFMQELDKATTAISKKMSEKKESDVNSLNVIKAPESFRIPGTDIAVKEGQEIVVYEKEMKEGADSTRGIYNYLTRLNWNVEVDGEQIFATAPNGEEYIIGPAMSSGSDYWGANLLGGDGDEFTFNSAISFLRAVDHGLIEKADKLK